MTRGRLAALVVALALAASTAGAAISPTSSGPALAAAITTNPSFVTGASFPTIPPSGTPDAVSTTPLAGFPTDGSSFAILSTGDATKAPGAFDPNDRGTNDGGGHVRGDTDLDVSVLRIDLGVPQGANCLSFDFRFLTEEYPKYVGQQYNDGFIAELDQSTWTTAGSAINAPRNFAFDPDGKVISVNTTGTTKVTAADAAGTSYGGATPVLSAQTPVTPGAHSLYLSIFDQGDAELDSAVFVDNLVLGQAAGGSCKKGATTSGGTPPPPGAPPTGTPSGGTVLVGGKTYTGGPIPYGSTVDVTSGRLTVKSDVGSVLVYGAGVASQFQLVRIRVAGKPYVQLRMTGGDFSSCPKGFRTTSGVGAKPPKPIRRLFAKGKGNFQTRGQYSSATVRGTSWVTTDRCDGTLTQVKQGIVDVFDFAKNQHVLVPAGHSYLAARKTNGARALAGHYTGTTSQGKTIAFDVTAGGAGVANVVTDAIVTCNGSLGFSIHFAFQGPIPLDPNRQFSVIYGGPVGIVTVSVTGTGTFDTAGDASGTITLSKASFTQNGTSYACTGAPFTWSAKKTS